MTNPELLYDQEAEEITLGCVLVDPDKFPQLYSIVKPADFFTDHCRHTYQAMVNLHKRSVPPDQFLVWRELKDLGWEEDGRFLSQMVFQCPSSFHIMYYAAIVRKFAERRAKLKKAGQLAKEAYDEKVWDGIEI